MMNLTVSKSLQASIIIPAFNEGETLALLLGEIKRKLADRLRIELVVVDDGSSDATYIVAHEAGATVVRHRMSLGYTEALKSGFRHSSFPNIVVFDASGKYDPLQIVTGLKLITEGQTDIAVGSRTEKKNSTVYKIGSNLLLFSVKFFTNLKINDPLSTFFCLRRRVLDRIDLTTNNTSVLIELLVKASRQGYQIGEFFVTERWREKQGTLDAKNLLSAIIRYSDGGEKPWNR